MTEFEEHILTVAAACKFIRASQNRGIFISAHQEAPIEGDADHVFRVSAHIKVSAPAAVEYMESAYNKHFEERGARVRITVSEHCIFIG